MIVVPLLDALLLSVACVASVALAFRLDVYGHLLKGQQRQAAEALDHLLA